MERSGDQLAPGRTILQDLCAVLWSFDPSLLEDVWASLSTEAHPLLRSRLPLPVPLPLEGHLNAVADALRAIDSDAWATALVMASDGAERSTAQAVALQDGNLALVLMLHAQEAGGGGGGVWAAPGGRVRSKGSTLAALELGFISPSARSELTVGGTALHGDVILWQPQPPTGLFQPHIKAAARELLSRLTCSCGAGTQRAHARDCLAAMHAQAHAEGAELRQERHAFNARARETMRAQRRSAPGLGSYFSEESRVLASKQAQHAAIADCALFMATNPGIAGAEAEEEEESADCPHDVVVGSADPSTSAAPLSIDLHGLSSAGAVAAVEDALASARAGARTRLHFITGRGKHSSSGTSTVREHVGALLRRLARSQAAVGMSGAQIVGLSDLSNGAGFDVTCE
jgi:hypothetical protein